MPSGSNSNKSLHGWQMNERVSSLSMKPFDRSPPKSSICDISSISTKSSHEIAKPRLMRIGRGLSLTQGELDAARQQLEQESARLADERARLESERGSPSIAVRRNRASASISTKSSHVTAKLRLMRIEACGLSLTQGELDASRQQLEQESARLADERARLESEHEALRSQSAEIEHLRHQQQIESRDREAQIAEDRLSLSLTQEEVGVFRQQFEQGFARLADEQTRFDSEREALRIQSAEFELLRQQYQIESRDREAQIAEDRLGLSLVQGELGASRKQFGTGLRTIGKRTRAASRF